MAYATLAKYRYRRSQVDFLYTCRKGGAKPDLLAWQFITDGTLMIRRQCIKKRSAALLSMTPCAYTDKKTEVDKALDGYVREFQDHHLKVTTDGFIYQEEGDDTRRFVKFDLGDFRPAWVNADKLKLILTTLGLVKPLFWQAGAKTGPGYPIHITDQDEYVQALVMPVQRRNKNLIIRRVDASPG